MGMFDRVMVRCPHCGGEVEFQSKAGECMLNTYRGPNIPVAIAADIHETIEECPKCGAGILVFCPVMTVQMSVEAFDNGALAQRYLEATKKLQEDE